MVEEGLAMNVGLNPTGADTFLTIGSGRAGMCFGSSAALRSVVDVLEGGLQGKQVETRRRQSARRGRGHRSARYLRSRSLDPQVSPQGGAGGSLEVHQVAHGARATGGVVRRQRLPACQREGVRLAGGEGDRVQVSAVQDHRSSSTWRLPPTPPTSALCSARSTISASILSATRSKRCWWVARTPSTPSTTPPRSPTNCLADYNRRVE